jgi:hypothetical protein
MEINKEFCEKVCTGDYLHYCFLKCLAENKPKGVCCYVCYKKGLNKDICWLGENKPNSECYYRFLIVYKDDTANK